MRYRFDVRIIQSKYIEIYVYVTLDILHLFVHEAI